MDALSALIGTTYGRLTVISLERNYCRALLVRCRCECGQECVIPQREWKMKQRANCGCLERERQALAARQEQPGYKRALMTFGNPFGLAIDDEQQRELSSPEASPLQSAAAARGAAPTAQPLLQSAAIQPPAVAPAGPGLAALDLTTIRQLHTTLRSLPAPHLAGFTKAFRKRFQVAEEAHSIADRILQKRRHDWIEAYLVQQMRMHSC